MAYFKYLETSVFFQNQKHIIFFVEILNFRFLLFLAVILAPEPFRKLWETGRNNFHQVW